MVLDDHSAGKIGNEQVRVFEVEPGEHRLYMRFVGLRRSEELRMSLKEGEEREFLCGTSGLGWPTLREASPEDVAADPGNVHQRAAKARGSRFAELAQNAILRASVTSWVRRRSPLDQPMTPRDQASSTTAQWTQPSPRSVTAGPGRTR